ncbi:MAG: class I SAM-dependent methyltransferase [Patescibacteria group bacterium]|nr:class I SAM-dependent methyltransferase [Patescibacteria group bacterium]
MAEQPSWQWDEMQQVGTDYADISEVERYERRMGQVRDLAAENAAILSLLALPEGAHILEIGTGTGHFARAAAQAGYRVTALDVSLIMLQYSASRAKAEGLAGIEYRHGGFLTFTEPPASFDAAVSVLALHHLPDLWKAVALGNVRRILKPAGRFLLGDVVFSSAEPDPRPCLAAWIADMPESMQGEVETHVGKEYSTLDWIMEGLLVRSGFAIERVVHSQSPIVQYVCTADNGPDQ